MPGIMLMKSLVISWATNEVWLLHLLLVTTHHWRWLACFNWWARSASKMLPLKLVVLICAPVMRLSSISCCQTLAGFFTPYLKRF